MSDSSVIASDSRFASGVHLVGSVPLADAEQVLRSVSQVLGPCLRRIPDGETGPRADWIVWQYPLLSSRPEFEVCPPGPDHYRALPRLRLREGVSATDIVFERLGYAEAAIASYRVFATLKRDGIVPGHCRLQVSLPTPLAPIGAFVAREDQSAVEPIYEARMLEEVALIVRAIPADQLAIQWDTNVEFAMLEGAMPAWFEDVRAGIIERLLRLSRHVPSAVELGYHLCYGDERYRQASAKDARRLVEVANALATTLDRPLNWLHMPVPALAEESYFSPMSRLILRDETQLFLGLIHLADGVEGAVRRAKTARAYVDGFGAATVCGWGRLPERDVSALLQLHAAVAQPVAPSTESTRPFSWPENFARVPADDWARQPVDRFGLAYDRVEGHGWYRNLDLVVDELASNLKEGDILVDYSGGTGILLDRLKLRIFDRQAGFLIVDSSPRFLRVAVEKFASDPRVSFRLLRVLPETRRLQRLDEVLDPSLLERGIDLIACTNAVHLYTDLEDTAAAWAKVLRPGGKLLINSGNIRNPRAKPNQWILDETVWVVNDLAEGIVRTDPRYAAYRPILDDGPRMEAHVAFRNRVFVEPRRLDFYLNTLRGAGFQIESVAERNIRARVDEWCEFLCAYHDAVLGWVGGNEKVDGRKPTAEAVEERVALIRRAIDTLFAGRTEFDACWTYITCVR
ncbi:MAG TPA: class I SAM-dependent methyltransferase [Candidatus Binataceae bacterium]|nr:class I SAM-dependent methyltransferase [Candidatus Binataceae bacterium]